MLTRENLLNEKTGAACDIQFPKPRIWRPSRDILGRRAPFDAVLSASAGRRAAGKDGVFPGNNPIELREYGGRNGTSGHWHGVSREGRGKRHRSATKSACSTGGNREDRAEYAIIGL